jgi:hypothetical protein
MADAAIAKALNMPNMLWAAVVGREMARQLICCRW